MTFSYMPYWRAVDAKVEGASQRIQEDAMNFAKIVESLGLQQLGNYASYCFSSNSLGSFI